MNKNKSLKEMMEIRRIENIVKKHKAKPLNGWILYQGLYEINWRNNKVINVRVGGKTFK